MRPLNPVYYDGRFFISLWEMSWPERLRALFFGKCWLWVQSIGQPPVALQVKRTVFSPAQEEK